MSWCVEYGSPGVGVPEDVEEILVFGYGCKFFRDDEKAGWIEREEHLIPWMGDPALRIDRYDGRGALSDLRPFLPQGDPQVGEEDPDLEALLQEERYRDLQEDEEYDDLHYQEVEFRKFQSDVNGVVGKGQYAAIGYSYDESEANTSAVYPEPKKLDEDLPYVKPPGLVIPDDITLPPTIKLHAIIEKTAKFIASHGNQMEIILKTKQSGNPLFNFLGYTDSLNPYYKFLVQVIRSNSYKPAEEVTEVEPTQQEECSESEDESSYLHPSLFRSATSEPPSKIPKITYKHPTGPTAYSMLVSKIKGSDPDPVASGPASSDAYNYYYSQGQDPSSNYFQAGAFPDQQANQYLDPSGAPAFRPQSQVPSQQDQLVIEKMASYVVKNGIAFEDLARTKGDPRFVFLRPTHEYHWYYLNCKERFKAETSAVVATGNFVSYSDSSTTTPATTSASTSLSKTIKSLEIRRISAPQKVPITLQSISLPLSASGIPIANHASISSRPATIPPEVASRIEEIKRKNSLFAKNDKEQLNSELNAPKKEKTKIQFSTSICKNMSLNSESVSETGTSTNESVIPDDCVILSHSKPISFRKPAENESEDVNLGNGSQAQKVVEETDEEEKERKRKEERRRKAALFLQRLQNKAQAEDPPAPKSPAESSNNNEIEKNGVEDGEISDVESIPDSARAVDEELKEIDGRMSDIERERLWDESPIFSREKDRSRHGSSSRSSSVQLVRSRSPSRRRSSRRTSVSPASHSSEESFIVRRKRSKSKHSKKRKKKRNKDRSSSSSRPKKSKKHKH